MCAGRWWTRIAHHRPPPFTIVVGAAATFSSVGPLLRLPFPPRRLPPDLKPTRRAQGDLGDLEGAERKGYQPHAGLAASSGTEAVPQTTARAWEPSAEPGRPTHPDDSKSRGTFHHRQPPRPRPPRPAPRPRGWLSFAGETPR